MKIPFTWISNDSSPYIADRLRFTLQGRTWEAAEHLGLAGTWMAPVRMRLPVTQTPLAYMAVLPDLRGQQLGVSWTLFTKRVTFPSAALWLLADCTPDTPDTKAHAPYVEACWAAWRAFRGLAATMGVLPANQWCWTSYRGVASLLLGPAEGDAQNRARLRLLFRRPRGGWIEGQFRLEQRARQMMALMEDEAADAANSPKRDRARDYYSPRLLTPEQTERWAPARDAFQLTAYAGRTKTHGERRPFPNVPWTPSPKDQP